MRKKSYYCRIALLLGCCWCLNFVIAYCAGVGPVDESWFLQVVNRVSEGDVLYRDVFFGATPLSVYLSALLFKIFGSELLVIKLFGALITTGSALLGARVYMQLTRQTSFPVGLMLVCSLLGNYWFGGGSLYSPLAYLFFLWAFNAFIEWKEAVARGGPYHNYLIKIGILTALCLLSKQNIGILLGIAIVASIAASAIQLRWPAVKLLRANLFIGLPLLAILCLGLMPLLLSGAGPSFLEYGFSGNSKYLRFGGVSYLEGLTELWPALYTYFSFGTIRWAIHCIDFAIPVLFLLLLFPMFIFARQDWGLKVAVVTFFACAFFGSYPRYDYYHLSHTVPALAPILWAVSHWLLSKFPILTWLGHGITLAIALSAFAGMVIEPLSGLIAGKYTISKLPHFSNTLFLSDTYKEFESNKDRLKTYYASKHPFFCMPHASFYYLAGGFKNPTPYDYCLKTSLGRNGELRLIEQIQGKEIEDVCWKSFGNEKLEAAALSLFVNQDMLDKGDQKACRAFRVAN
ncbi:MAG: hypothetical protein V2B20_11420 [Pseudomonadota bacterium]